MLSYTNDVKQKVFEENFVLGRDTGASSGHDKLIERANLGYTIYFIESTVSGATGNHNKLIEQANLLSKKYGNFDYHISADGKTFQHAIAVADYDKEKITDNAKESDVYTDIEDLTQVGYKIIRPPLRKGNKLGRWTWDKETFKSYWNNNEVLIKKGKTKVNVIKKVFVSDEDITEIDGEKYFIKTNKLPLQSIININNSDGTSILSGNDGILPGCDFPNPKSPNLIKFLIKSYEIKNITILDFFAGSGTTLHATMQLNNEDGGNRQCILVTNNENNICEEVTYERNKRVIQGYTNQKGENIEGLKKNNLRYYKIKAVGREKTLKNKKTLVALSCGMLNIKENIYKEENTFGSLLLKKNKCRYFSQGQKQMLVIIDEEWIAKIVEQLKNKEVKEPIKIYVFSNSVYAWDDDFYEVRDKVEPCALPEAIYNAYKHILPEVEDKIIDTGEEKTLTDEQEEELLRMYEKAMQEEE